MGGGVVEGGGGGGGGWVEWLTLNFWRLPPSSPHFSSPQSTPSSQFLPIPSPRASSLVISTPDTIFPSQSPRIYHTPHSSKNHCQGAFYFFLDLLPFPHDVIPIPYNLRLLGYSNISRALLILPRWSFLPACSILGCACRAFGFCRWSPSHGSGCFGVIFASVTRA